MKRTFIWAALAAWTMVVAETGFLTGQIRSGIAEPTTLLFALRHICTPGIGHPSDTRFIGQIDATMAKMMIEMAVTPTGSADTDFVAAMVPHHQGAIEMAEAELQYGRNAQLARIAQEVIVTQQQEIAAMRLAVGQPRAASAPARDQITEAKDL
jgi:hypothetical protein